MKEQLFENLFNALEMQGSLENEYLMKGWSCFNLSNFLDVLSGQDHATARTCSYDAFKVENMPFLLLHTFFVIIALRERSSSLYSGCFNVFFSEYAKA